MASNRMSRQEWERIKVEDFERLEADLATERARADALAVENAELRAALSNLSDVVEDARSIGEMQGEDFRLSPWADLERASERYGVLLAADPAQRGAELIEAADSMREALVRLTPGPHIGATSGPESEGVRALKMWDCARTDLRGGRAPEDRQA